MTNLCVAKTGWLFVLSIVALAIAPILTERVLVGAEQAFEASSKENATSKIAPWQFNQDEQATEEQSADEEATSEDIPEIPEIDEDNLVRIHEEAEVWFDNDEKFVLVNGAVCLRQGLLEVFACPRGTKEHESVVKVNSPAFLVHAAMLRIGAIPGKPVSFHPTYEPAEGMVIDIWVLWEDEEGNAQQVRAQEWVRNIDSKEQLEHDWVFGGSGFWTDEETGTRYYQAEGGELVCLSNFATATMDLPVESTQVNDQLLFEPFTERIPNRGTDIRLLLKPRIPPKDDDQDASDDSADSGDSDDSDDSDDDDSSDDDSSDDDSSDDVNLRRDDR